MDEKIIIQQISGINTCIYVSSGQSTIQKSMPCIYIAGEEDINQNKDLVCYIAKKLEFQIRQNHIPPVVLVCPAVRSWNDCYSPWPVKLGNTSFSGKASDYFSIIFQKIQPYLQINFNCAYLPEETFFIGYSLAGLAALYGYFSHPFFAHCASVSGSLWYPGWLPFLEKKCMQLSDRPGKIYLSLGKKEIKTRSLMMRENKSCLENTYALLAETLGQKNVYMEWNNGNHFYEIPERHLRAVYWLLQNSLIFYPSSIHQ